MNNIMGQILDEDDEIVLNIVNSNLNVVAYVVQNLHPRYKFGYKQDYSPIFIFFAEFNVS